MQMQGGRRYLQKKEKKDRICPKHTSKLFLSTWLKILCLQSKYYLIIEYYSAHDPQRRSAQSSAVICMVDKICQ